MTSSEDDFPHDLAYAIRNSCHILPAPNPKPGWSGALTPQQQQCFSLVQQRFTFNGSIDPLFASEMFLLKFCRARDFKVEKVMEMLERHFNWRAKPLFQNPTAKMGHVSNSVPINELCRTGPHPSIAARIPQFKKFYPTGYMKNLKSHRFCFATIYTSCVFIFTHAITAAVLLNHFYTTT